MPASCAQDAGLLRATATAIAISDSVLPLPVGNSPTPLSPDRARALLRWRAAHDPAVCDCDPASPWQGQLDVDDELPSAQPGRGIIQLACDATVRRLLAGRRLVADRTGRDPVGELVAFDLMLLGLPAMPEWVATAPWARFRVGPRRMLLTTMPAGLEVPAWMYRTGLDARDLARDIGEHWDTHMSTTLSALWQPADPQGLLYELSAAAAAAHDALTCAIVH
jgi:hypothetical protein